MLFTPDMKDLLRFFEKHDVQYVLVGGFAVNYYGYMRMTQDVDFLIYPSLKNAGKTMEALADFGFGEAGIPRAYFEREGSAVHLGVEPNRIDLLTHLQGLKNKTIFDNRQRIVFEGVSIYIISLPDLMAVKRGSRRLKDRADADELAKTKGPRRKVKSGTSKLTRNKSYKKKIGK